MTDDVKTSNESLPKAAIGTDATTSKALKASSYRKALSSTQLRVGFAGIFLLMTAIALLRGSPDVQEIKKAVEAPQNLSIVQIELPVFSALQDAEKAVRVQRAEGSSAARMATMKLPGLKLIKRSDKLTIPPGTIVAARLLSGASNGIARVELLEAVKKAGEVMIPSGAILLGEGSSTERRLNIHFTQAVTREGEAFEIQAQALDSSDKSVGIKGSKVSRYMSKLGAALGLNIVAGAGEVFQDKSITQGVEVQNPTIKNAVLSGAQTTAIEESRSLMEGLKNETPIIEVPSGTEILIIFSS